MTINYYTLEKIESDPDFPRLKYGYKNNKFAEVFTFSSDETEEGLIEEGYAKCDAPDWDETMIIAESGWAYLNDPSSK